MQSFEHPCGGRKVFLQYGHSVRSFPKKVSGGQEQEQVLVTMEFTDQVSTFVDLKLWNGR